MATDAKTTGNVRKRETGANNDVQDGVGNEAKFGKTAWTGFSDYVESMGSQPTGRGVSANFEKMLEEALRSEEENKRKEAMKANLHSMASSRSSLVVAPDSSTVPCESISQEGKILKTLETKLGKKIGGSEKVSRKYRGRLAPSPSGYLHLGHAQTFWIAMQRAKSEDGELFLRVEDLDRQRCKPELLESMLEDMKWLGLQWTGCIVTQSERRETYLEAWRHLQRQGLIYQSPHSRKDVLAAITAPHEGDNEVIFPLTLRPIVDDGANNIVENPGGVNWRFKVPDGRVVSYVDRCCGLQHFVGQKDFGDFVIWSGHNDLPSYEMAVVVDDAAMGCTEIVRGGDLLLSTAKQILLYEVRINLLKAVNRIFGLCSTVTMD